MYWTTVLMGLMTKSLIIEKRSFIFGSNSSWKTTKVI